MVDPTAAAGEESDLATRLKRYRRRVEAEGRKRSLPIIDRAIVNAGPSEKTELGENP